MFVFALWPGWNWPVFTPCGVAGHYRAVTEVGSRVSHVPCNMRNVFAEVYPSLNVQMLFECASILLPFMYPVTIYFTYTCMLVG